MILVQNHRLPLNGNKFIAVIAFFVFIVGCTPKVRVLRPAGDKTVPKTEKPSDKTETEEPVVVKRDVNNIALLLPFQLDKASKNAPSAADVKRSALALDFYQGFKLGLDALTADGVNFKVDVLDTRDDAAENVRIASTPEVQEASLVVGPVYPKEIMAFGQQANLGKVLQLSPLAASMPSEFNLPNLATLTAPIVTHVRALAAHIARQYKTGDVVLLYTSPDANSRQFLEPLKSEIQRLNKNIGVFEVNDSESLDNRVRLSGKNIVVCGTTNKYQITPLLSHLTTLQDELSHEIQLVGHPNWAKMDFDDADGLGKFSTYITSSYYVDKRASAVRAFDQQYQQEFGVAPTEFSYKGYDAAFYFGSLLAKYGDDYMDHITDEEYDGLHNTLKFEYNPAWGYVNSYISILQYGNNGFHPVK